MTAETHSRSTRRKVKRRTTDLEWFKIKVTASAASVSYRGPGLSRTDPDGDADSVIKIEGILDRPVLKRATAFIYVFLAHPLEAIPEALSARRRLGRLYFACPANNLRTCWRSSRRSGSWKWTYYWKG
jgi:hypothetical protein